MTTSVGIVGFRGYSGAELVRILERHSHVEPVLMEHRSDSAPETLPRGAKGSQKYTLHAGSSRVRKSFCCVPGYATRSVDGTDAGILEAGAKVIDLSGAFRLRTAETYKQWYKSGTHTARTLSTKLPTAFRSFAVNRIRGARLVSNPGCYPTAANLAIKPLV